MPYNLSTINNATNFFELTAAVNSLSDNLLSIFILIVVFFSLYYMFRNNEPIKAIVSSMTITTAIAVFLFVLGMITNAILLPIVILEAVVVLILILK